MSSLERGKGPHQIRPEVPHIGLLTVGREGGSGDWSVTGTGNGGHGPPWGVQIPQTLVLKRVC